MPWRRLGDTAIRRWRCWGRAWGALFAAGDAAQQQLQAGHADWRQTRQVALVVLAFHRTFSYAWLGALERFLPGWAPVAVLAKVASDQLLGAPLAISAFYTGMSILQGKEDILADWRQKFWNTYKLSNFSLVPVCLRTAFSGLCGFLWAFFLCFSQQSGDGRASSAFKMFRGEEVGPEERTLPGK